MAVAEKVRRHRGKKLVINHFDFFSSPEGQRPLILESNLDVFRGKISEKLSKEKYVFGARIFFCFFANSAFKFD